MGATISEGGERRGRRLVPCTGWGEGKTGKEEREPPNEGKALGQSSTFSCGCRPSREGGGRRGKTHAYPPFIGVGRKKKGNRTTFYIGNAA